MNCSARKENHMILDAGILRICKVDTEGENGTMQKEHLIPLRECFYGERTVGYGRHYAAKGASEQIDLLVRIWEDRGIRAGMYVVLENDDQYRVEFVQHLLDEDGLRITDLTLIRLDDLYDIQ